MCLVMGAFDCMYCYTWFHSFPPATAPPRHHATTPPLSWRSHLAAVLLRLTLTPSWRKTTSTWTLKMIARGTLCVCVWGGGRRKEGPRHSPTPDCAVLLCRFSLRFEKESKSEIERRKRISRQPLRHLDPVSWTQLQPLLAFLVPMAFFLVHSYGRM